MKLFMISMAFLEIPILGYIWFRTLKMQILYVSIFFFARFFFSCRQRRLPLGFLPSLRLLLHWQLCGRHEPTPKSKGKIFFNLDFFTALEKKIEMVLSFYFCEREISGCQVFAYVKEKDKCIVGFLLSVGYCQDLVNRV